MNDKNFEFKCKVIKCVYDSQDFKTYAVCVDEEKYPMVKQNKYKNVSLIGNLPDLTLDVEYDVVAVEKDTKYGISYDVIQIRRDVPKEPSDVYTFLKEVLTEQQAKTLMEHYPDIIERVRENRLDDIDLNLLNGIKEKTFNKIKEKIVLNFYLIDLIAKFKNTLSFSILRQIYAMYHSIDIIEQKLKEEPYSTLIKISGVGFKTADSIIIKMQEENIIDFGCDIKTSADRCRSCLLFLLKENESEGNTKMNLLELRKNCTKLTPECFDYFSDVIKEDEFYYNKENMEVSLKKTYDIEKYIAENIITRSNIKTNVWNYDIEKYRKIDDSYLSDEQMNLLDSVCNNNVTILTAPAGAGKSFSTKALINMLKEHHRSFILASPTGKAAKKLSEYTGEIANTIHRTLGYYKNGFFYNENNKINTDIIIVDEIGMVDIKLFCSLLKALNINTKIVLIGDVYQLNSIGCGALLRDLVSCNKLQKIVLTKIYRMGVGGVLTACTYIRQNQKFINSNSFTQIGEDRSYSFIPASKNNMNTMIVALYKKLLKTHKASDITVISSYNVGENGCVALNKLLQPIANPNVNNDNNCITLGKEEKQIKYYVGDIVIQCVNNYNAIIDHKDNYIDLNIDDSNDDDDENKTCFVPNGEQGVIVEINNEHIIIQFSDINVKYHKSEIATNIRHAFAISCHKMQGSQNKIIIFCCPSSHIYMLSNNIIYTAISRAEETVYHFSDVKTINIAMRKSDSNKRSTFLGDMLNGLI